VAATVKLQEFVINEPFFTIRATMSHNLCRAVHCTAIIKGPMLYTYCTAWCLKNESVHCVVLGASNVDQLYEDMQAIQVFTA